MAEAPRDGGNRQWHKRPQDARSPGAVETPAQSKRGKSEETEVQPHELKFEDDRMDDHAAIKDIVDAVKDVKEDVRGQRNQLAHLLYTQVDRQRSESSTKLLLKNFWKYSEATSQTLLQSHRETIFQWIAKEAGLSDSQIKACTYNHTKGRYLSPFTLVDVKEAMHRQTILQWYKQEITGKGLHIQEWPTQDAMQSWQSAPGNVQNVNGCIKLEPCIGSFDKLQSEPLKAAMTAVSNLTQRAVEFRHSRKNLTIQNKENDKYLVWVALDHLYGVGTVYINREELQEKEFEKAFREAYEAILSRKAVGNKGAGKERSEKGISTDDFLKAVGLSGDGKGSYLKGGILAIKARSPFMFEIKGIAPDQFGRKYEAHLTLLADRILHPNVML